MPRTEKKYPDWVQAQRIQGTTVKKKGDNYYLYKRTSRRVPGKKYPQPVDTYIGLITPDGILESGKRKVSLSEIQVWEYGFSNAVIQLCPERWKVLLGDKWKAVLKAILLNESKASYVGRNDKEWDTSGVDLGHISIPAHTISLKRRFLETTGDHFEILEELKRLYLVSVDGKEVLSAVNPEQKKLIERFGLKMEVY